MRTVISIVGMAMVMSLFIISTALSETCEEFIVQGRQQFSQGEYDSAYHSFYQAFRNDPTSLQINFMLGRSAFESGRLEEAVMTYERILFQEPESPRVKLELARTYLRLGSRKQAEQLFNQVLAAEPPDPVRHNINRYLKAITGAEKRHFLSGAFTLGFGYDDNVRTTPADDIIRTVIGEVHLTGPGAEPLDNYLLNTSLVLEHLYRPSADSSLNWKSTFTSYNIFNETANDLDINLFGFSSGPVWQRGRFSLHGNLILNHIELGYDRYLGIYGLGCSFSYRHSPLLTLNSYFSLLDKNFYQDGGKDSTNTAVSLGPVFVYGRNRLSLTARYEKESAYEDLNNTYERYSIAARYDRKLFTRYNLFFSCKRQESDYEGLAPLFNREREDETNYYNLGISRILWSSSEKNGRSLIGRISHTYIDAESTIELYEYDKNVTTLAVTFTF